VIGKKPRCSIPIPLSFNSLLLLLLKQFQEMVDDDVGNLMGHTDLNVVSLVVRPIRLARSGQRSTLGSDKLEVRSERTFVFFKLSHDPNVCLRSIF
jgi:hypothetical protein